MRLAVLAAALSIAVAGSASAAAAPIPAWARNHPTTGGAPTAASASPFSFERTRPATEWPAPSR